MPELPRVLDLAAAIGMDGHGLVAISLSLSQIASPTASILANTRVEYVLNTAPYTRYVSDGVTLNAVNNPGGTLTTGTVQGLIDQAVANKVDKGSSISNLDATPLLNSLNASSFLDPTTGVSITQALQDIRQSILALGSGATPPTITTDPTVAFPGGTGDVGETFTITPGTIAGGANTGTLYQVVVDGVPKGQLFASTTGTLLAAWFTGTRLFRVIQNVTSTTGANVTRSSTTYTLNVAAAIPVAQTPPSWSAGTPQIGTVYTLNDGSASNTPTIKVRSVYRGFVSPASPGTLATTAGVDQSSYTVVAADQGLQLAILETWTNAAGTNSPLIAANYSSPILIASAGGAPQWVDTAGNAMTGTNTAGTTGAVLPGFPLNAYSPGDSDTLDLGLTIGNLATVNYQFLRDGAPGGMPSASGVTSVTYNFTSLDDGHIISCVLTPVSGGGVGRSVTVAGVLVASSAAGGGVLSGAVTAQPDNTAGTAYNLTTLGTVDWYSYLRGVGTVTPDRKATGPGGITLSAATGTVVNGSAGHFSYFFKHTDGTPNATNPSGALGDDGYTYVSPASGLLSATIAIPISTTQRTVTIYFGHTGPSDTLAISASLSDGSAPNYTFSNTTGYNNTLVLSVKAGTSATLSVNFSKFAGTGDVLFFGQTVT